MQLVVHMVESPPHMMRSDEPLQLDLQDISVQVVPLHEPQQISPGQSAGPAHASSTAPQLPGDPHPISTWLLLS